MEGLLGRKVAEVCGLVRATLSPPRLACARASRRVCASPRLPRIEVEVCEVGARVNARTLGDYAPLRNGYADLRNSLQVTRA